MQIPVLVIGNEIVPVLVLSVELYRVPPNVYFQIDDAESEWTFEKDSFDLIHIRHLGGAIGDWNSLLAQSYKWVTI